MRATWQVILVVAASALSVSFLAGSRALAAGDAPVRIESGLLAGVAGEDPGVRVFRGVPYAAPPVGPLRWRAPQAVARWEGVRKADQFAAVCSQPTRTGISALLPTAPRLTPPGEDCLYLNVWTAAK